MLPSPPHWATKLPPGRSAARRRANSRSWSAIQWKVAVERIASTGSSSSSSSRSDAWTSARPSAIRPASRSLAASTIDAEPSTAITRPRGSRAAIISLMRPEPQPASRTVSSPSQLQAREHLRAPALLDAGDAVVARSIPLLVWHTTVRYHARCGRRAPRSPRDSWPPCQASGERWRAFLLDEQLRAGDRLRVAFADRERMAGVGLVAAGDDDRRHRRSRRSCGELSNGRERGTASSASATAAGARARPGAGAARSRSWRARPAGTRREVVGRHEALDAPLAQPARERIPALELGGARAGSASGRRRA